MMDPALSRAYEEMRAGRMQSALETVRGFLRKHPKDHNAAQILAFLLVQSGKREEALPYLAMAVAAEPRATQYRNNYANTLLQLKRFAEAVQEWERAVELDPRYGLGWLGLAVAKMQLRDLAGAEKAAKQGLALRSENPRQLAVDPLQATLRSTYLLLLNYSSKDDADLFEEHRTFGRIHGLPANPPRVDPTPNRALRLGFLSGDLRTHSVAFFAEPLLRHTPADAEATVFSLSATPQDPTTRRLQSLVKHWCEVGTADNLSLNRDIRARKIDVLIELHGHTGGNRLLALADKPAPVIVTALGYPNTTGLPAVDWRLVDSITDPPGTEALSTERLMRLDPCFLCYTPPADAPPPVLPAASAPFTFGCFNALPKLSLSTLELWGQIMAAAPHSRLFLKTDGFSDLVATNELLEDLARVGITRERVQIAAHTDSFPEHLQAYSRVHVALDPTPYNGTTTTCEALWMGVPVVCLAGSRHGARVSASLLTTIGRSDLVARSRAEYVAMAVRLAHHPDELAPLRFSLRESMRQSPLLDDVGYAERFYAAVRACWVDWCEAQKE
jgi:predicted O-linked N-acetylglucosamine transferase (SPINDLY family)